MKSNNENVVITSAVRTAVGAFDGSLKRMQGHDLGSVVIKEVLKKSKLICQSEALLVSRIDLKVFEPLDLGAPFFTKLMGGAREELRAEFRLFV